MWGVHEGMGWWMLFGSLWTLLFWGIVIAAMAWLVLRLATDSGERKGEPLEIAKERYARGDIGREEFERIRQDLAHGR